MPHLLSASALARLVLAGRRELGAAILAAGRLTPGAPPLLGVKGELPADTMANALPQALLLTAIVIGFGLFAFALALTIRAYRSFGHLEVDRMRSAEPAEERE